MEQKFLEFVAEIMELDLTDVNLDMKYKEGVWDSLMMLTLVMELEAEYGVSIPMEKVNEIKTLRNLFEIIR